MPGQNKTVKAGAETEVGIYKRNKKEKKERNHALEQESDQENKEVSVICQFDSFINSQLWAELRKGPEYYLTLKIPPTLLCFLNLFFSIRIPSGYPLCFDLRQKRKAGEILFDCYREWEIYNQTNHFFLHL